MRDQPGQNVEYKGFKPWGKPGWPGGPPLGMGLPLIETKEGDWIFLDAPENTILWHALFYDEESALRVFDYLAKGNLLNDKV